MKAFLLTVVALLVAQWYIHRPSGNPSRYVGMAVEYDDYCADEWPWRDGRLA